MRYLDSLSNDVYLVVWFQGGREDAREFARECSRKQAEGRVQEIFERALRRSRPTSTGSRDLQINEDNLVREPVFVMCLDSVMEGESDIR
jgi:hypothetical protein